MQQGVEVSTIDDQSRMDPSEVSLEQVLRGDSGMMDGEVVALGALDECRKGRDHPPLR